MRDFRAVRPIEAKAPALIAALLVAAAPAGCGDRGGDAEEALPPAPAKETADPLPDLPKGWSKEVNHDAGFAFGLPPGWTATEREGPSLVRSPDRLVAVSLTADRTDNALGPAFDQYTSATAADLERVFSDLDPGRPQPYSHHYRALAVEASGRARESGVRQDLLLVTLRRSKLAAFTALAAVNAKRQPKEHMRQAERIISTIRGRPVTFPASSGD